MGALRKRAEGVYLFWAALQTPILHPLYSADRSYTYWLSVERKWKHTLCLSKDLMPLNYDDYILESLIQQMQLSPKKNKVQ